MKRTYRILISLLLFTALAQSSVVIYAQPFAPKTAVAKVVTPSPLLLPLREGSVRFAVFGDTGSGKSTQYDLGRMMNTYHINFPFDTVLMAGDNIYGAEKAADMKV